MDANSSFSLRGKSDRNWFSQFKIILEMLDEERRAIFSELFDNF